MRLPQIRTALLTLANDIEGAGLDQQARRLRELAEETKRRPAVRRAPARAAPMTPELRAEIEAAARTYPSWSLARLGAFCGVNQGRVSEVLAGTRT